MNKLSRPEFQVGALFILCVEGCKEPRKTKLLNCYDEIVVYSAEFEEKMLSGEVHKIKIVKSLNGLSPDELIYLYKSKMVAKKSPGRNLYDSIMILPQNGICPYCGQRIVSNLDHFLPQSLYIPLIITPQNLIPCCRDCNYNKRSRPVTKSTEALFNPYYEDSDKFNWLKATLIHNDDSEFLTMTFSVKKSDDFDMSFYDRICNQFQILGLNELYSLHAAQELIIIDKKYTRLLRKCGRDYVIENIREDLEDYTMKPNFWKTALLRELLDDNWFIDFLLNVSRVA